MINGKEKTIDAMIISIIIIVSYSVIFHFASIGMDAHHDGFMFKTALDLAHGKVMYRDTYSQYGILTSYIQALFILVFGERVLSIRIATVVTYVLVLMSNFLIWKRYMNRGLAVVLTTVAMFMGPYYSWIFLPWSSVYSLLFLMLGLYFYILYTDKKNIIFLSICAVCTMCAFWCRQPVGLVLVIAFYIMQLIFWWISPDSKTTVFKECCTYTLTLTVCIVLFAIYLFISGSAGDFWIQNIKDMAHFGITHSAGSSTGISRYHAMIKSLIKCLLGTGTGEYVWGLLALICVLSFGIKVFSCKKKQTVSLEDKCILMINMYACASWHQYFPVTCIRHCYWGAFPMLGIVLYNVISLCRTVYPRKNRGKNLPIYIMAVAAFLVINRQVLMNRFSAIKVKSGIEYQYVEGSGYDFLDGLKLSEEQREFYYSIHMAIKSTVEETGKEVMNYSPHGYFAVFNDENYHKQYNKRGGTVYSDYEETAQRYIEEKEPIIIAASGMEISGYHVYFTSSGDIGNWVIPLEISVYVHD